MNSQSRLAVLYASCIQLLIYSNPKSVIAAIAILAMLTPATHGNVVSNWTGGTSAFETASNWDNGLPGSTAGAPNFIATIGNGDTVDLSSNYSAANPYRLTVNGNSTLNVSASVEAGFLNIASGSTVNLLSGSAFTMPKVSSGNNNGYSINGTLEISGGTHVLNERLFGSGTIRVIGDEASINLHQIGGSGQDYEFVFDPTGVSGLVGGGTGIGNSGAGPYWVLNGSTLSVDGSAFNGSGTFTLFDTTDRVNSFFNTSDITVTGLGAEGTGWTLDQRVAGGRNLVELTVVAVPEPSAVGILSLGLTCLVLRRRRKATSNTQTASF